MNYVSIEVLLFAKKWMDAIERFRVENPDVSYDLYGLACAWQQDSTSAPCGKPAEYLVPDGTRVSLGGDIESAPQWRCKKHLEQELGADIQEQPLFRRIRGVGGDEGSE